MSKTSIVVLVLAIAALAAGITWFVVRHEPTELDIAAKESPPLPDPKIAADDWPWWRGAHWDAHSPDAAAPTSWSESENIAWKTAIPGRGHSTPIVVGKRIFLTSADETNQRQLAICLDRDTGKLVWEKTIHEKHFPSMHRDNSHASSTPASDGERLFVAFDNDKAIYVTALDLNGELIWQKEVGPHGGTGLHGFASSLTIWGKFVYVSDDSPLNGMGWIAGLNRETGDMWRIGRKTGLGSYGSPVIVTLNNKAHLIVPGNSRISAYDPNDGSIIWERGGLGEVSANSVSFSPNMVFATSGYPRRKLFALRSDGSILWRVEDKSLIPYPPSTLWANGFLYVVGDEGLMTCFNAENGDEKWQERIGSRYYSSPLLVGKNIYVCGLDGKTTIVEANPEAFTEVNKCKLDGSINASPVALGGKLYIRTETHLYCIGK